MNARASENYLAISRSSSPSKSVEIFWAEIYWGRLFFTAESSLIQSSCRSFIRVIVPNEISKVNFRVEANILVSMSEEILNEDPGLSRLFWGVVVFRHHVILGIEIQSKWRLPCIVDRILKSISFPDGSDPVVSYLLYQ
jgi:hypothetical protein